MSLIVKTAGELADYLSTFQYNTPIGILLDDDDVPIIFNSIYTYRSMDIENGIPEMVLMEAHSSIKPNLT